jgi:hypothetical protein
MYGLGVAVQTPPHTEKAESEKVRYYDWVARPDPHHTQEKAESEKVRYGGPGMAPRPHLLTTQEKAERR